MAEFLRVLNVRSKAVADLRFTELKVDGRVQAGGLLFITDSRLFMVREENDRAELRGIALGTVRGVEIDNDVLVLGMMGSRGEEKWELKPVAIFSQREALWRVRMAWEALVMAAAPGDV